MYVYILHPAVRCDMVYTWGVFRARHLCEQKRHRR